MNPTATHIDASLLSDDSPRLFDRLPPSVRRLLTRIKDLVSRNSQEKSPAVIAQQTQVSTQV